MKYPDSGVLFLGFLRYLGLLWLSEYPGYPRYLGFDLKIGGQG